MERNTVFGNLLIYHVWRGTDGKKGSQNTIVSTIKVRVDRNSTFIPSKQKFSPAFIYLQRTDQNSLNSPRKPKETPFPTFL